ncbi:MAG: GatB/YqeY domain-containing protein [Bacteroidota bacterium]
MSLETQVMELMKEAMKAKDDATLRGVRAIKAAIIIAKTSEGAGGILKEEDETKLLQKLVKQRRDSLEIFQKQGREDLAVKEQEEITVISRFLPAQLEGDALKDIIKNIITSVGATSPADMGKVMGAANKQLAGKTDGKSISAVVKELLAG